MVNKVEICGVNTSKLPTLSAQEKKELFERIKKGDSEARETFIRGNLRLVLSVIGRFNNRGENVDDLFQVGCIGLIKSIDNFNTELDVQFSTYAVPMIIGEIRRYLRDNNASYESVQDLFKTNFKDYKQESQFGEKIEIYRNCMAIALNDKGADASDRITAARVADNLLMLEDVVASFALVLIDNVVHISARSNGTVNVQLILESLNGGGRYDAAGAQVKDTIASTLMRLKAAIDDYINPEE